jgi:Mg2+ and Co2+ transporter CorA
MNVDHIPFARSDAAVWAIAIVVLVVPAAVVAVWWWRDAP